MPDVTIQKHLQSASMITGRRSGRSTLTRRRDTILLVVCIGDWRLGTEEHLHSPLEFRGSECESIYMTISSLQSAKWNNFTTWLLQKLFTTVNDTVTPICGWYLPLPTTTMMTMLWWYLPLPTAKARSNNNLNSNFVYYPLTTIALNRSRICRLHDDRESGEAIRIQTQLSIIDDNNICNSTIYL